MVAVTGTKLWTGANWTINSLPSFLEGASLYPLPWEKHQEGLKISVVAGESATVYIAYANQMGWPKDKLCDCDFEESKGHPLISTSAYTLSNTYKKRINAGEKLELPPTEPVDSKYVQIALFIKIGNPIVNRILL